MSLLETRPQWLRTCTNLHRLPSHRKHATGTNLVISSPVIVRDYATGCGSPVRAARAAAISWMSARM